MSYSNIPVEVQQFPHWVMWRYEIQNGRQTKVPCTVAGHRANINEPATWCSFEQALTAVHAFDGIGFVLTQNDPFAVLDLDDKAENPATPEQRERHQALIQGFDSYTERSPSGRGHHIVVKGRIPIGMDRDHVGVYSDKRFITFTGHVDHNVPIAERQEYLDWLCQRMAPPIPATTLVEHDAILDDKDLVDMAMRATNSDKFNQLCRGEWKEMGFPSQSEADFALASMFCFYTRDNEQVRRLFRMSHLGKRDKATRDNKYLNRMLEKIRAVQGEVIDLSELIENAKPVATMTEQMPKVELAGISLPPGLVGELAQYFYSAAIRPVPEVALGAALAITSGICGRAYNISGVGLNQYMILLARTGAGKEGAASGVENLIAAVRPQLPMIDQFIGPAAFASGQALIRVLDSKPCFVALLGEFGLTLQQLSDHRANSTQIMLRRVLLDLYAKSGWNRILQSNVYSDTEKNTSVIQAPCVTILGESTPETFFDGLDVSHVTEGLIPRFSVIEYTGPRPPRNRNANHPPPAPLIQRFADLAAISITTSNNNTVHHVQCDAQGQQMLDVFDASCDGTMNDARGEVELQIWNRAHLKALKLSALLAVGVNPHAPMVTGTIAQWAIDFVTRDCELITARFQAGDIGTGDSKQFNDLKRTIEAFFRLDHRTLGKYGVPTKMIQDKIIPYSYLARRTASLASYRTDRSGATGALKRTVQSLVDSGMLVEVNKPQLQKNYLFSGVAYGVGKHWI